MSNYGVSMKSKVNKFNKLLNCIFVLGKRKNSLIISVIFLLSTFSIFNTQAFDFPTSLRFNSKNNYSNNQSQNSGYNINQIDPYSDVYKEFNINQNDLFNALNSPNFNPTEIASDTWIDNFDANQLNDIWNNFGQNFAYNLDNGYYIGTLKSGSLSYNVLYLNTPDFSGDFEIETKIQTNRTDYRFSLLAWDRADNITFHPNKYMYLGYSPDKYSNAVIMSKDVDNISATISRSIIPTDLVTKGIYLKLSCINSTFYGYYSFDLSVGWNLIGQINGLTINKFNVGIYSFTTNGPSSVSYDYFSLRSDQSIHILQTLRDNFNDYDQVWEPWITKSAVHKAAVSDSGDLLVVAGGYLLDTSLHIYRWDYYQRKYVKVYEAGAGVIKGDVYDIAFGDTDSNRLMEVAAASADGHIYLFEQNHIYDPNTNLESKFDLVWKSGLELTKQVSTVDIFDADLDNLPDLIVGSYDKKIHIYEYYNHSNYPFASTEHRIDLAEKYVSPALDDAILSLASGDFNNNGLPDFIVGTRSGSVYIFENAGIIIDVHGTPTLLPWDNNYKIIANFSNSNKPLWYPVTKIGSGNIDSIPGDDAVLLVWGQGTYIVRYDSSKGFYFEQLVYPFKNWESKLPFSLDNYADWMKTGTTQNVWHDIGSGKVMEPICCDINLYTNTASGYAPDGKYTHFSSTTNQNATATYELFSGEYLASNGNSDPDLYIIFDKIHAVLLNSWTIEVSQNDETWYTVNKEFYKTSNGTLGQTLTIDLDYIFSTNKISYIKYIKLTLSGAVDQEQLIDALFYPFAYRPLTTATSLMIKPLKLNINDDLDSNKVLFGTTDGRFLAYKYETNSSKFVYQNSDGLALSLNYGIIPDTYLEIWDSFEDDNYNLKTTIWDLFYTPKQTFIPSWRYTSGQSQDFSDTQFRYWSDTSPNTRLQSFDIYPVNPFDSDSNLIVTTNTSTDSNEKILLYSSSTGLRAKVGTFDLTNYYFNTINTDFGASTPIVESLTINLGDLYSNHYGKEILVFPWYQDGRPFLVNNPVGSYGNIAPRIYYRVNYNESYSNSYLLNSPLFNSINDFNNFTAFYLNSNTFPSGKIIDLNNDGLQDIIVSNGTLIVLWNVGKVDSPKFIFDSKFFEEINANLVDKTIFQPQAWDYDNDGDQDIGFSYGRHLGEPVYGFDFFEQTGNNSLGNFFWSRNLQMVENPSKNGSLISNRYTIGLIIPSSTCKQTSIYQSCSTADSFWVYSPKETNTNKQRLIKLQADVTSQTSFIVGTNPYIMKIEANRFQDPPNSINMGYATMISWSNRDEVKDWTQALGISDIDNDGKKEVIVGDYDNNIYSFEHLSNNTYKILFKSHDLNHTEITNLSPYLFQDLTGISGNFSRIIYDHADFIATGVDFNNDGLNGFVVASGNTIYVYEGTGYNDEAKLYLQFDIGNYFSDIAGFDSKTEKITALDVTKDFDGRGSMIAVAIRDKLFLFRVDSHLGLVESFQFKTKGSGYELPGNPFAFPKIIIQSIMFADMNKDGITELWIAGINQTTGNNGFISAICSDNAGNLYLAYNFDQDHPLFTKDKIINALTTSDIDIDGNLELVIGHSLGVDIYEFSSHSSLKSTRLDTITSDYSYALLNGIDPNIYDGIVNVNAIAVGDTDLDLRSEIIISHDTRISVLEAQQDLTGKISHNQVWTSPSFKDKANTIKIDDVNGNDWPEILITIKGDDVYAFECSFPNQPKASQNYLTQLVNFVSYNTTGTDLISYDSLYFDRNNDGIEDTYIFSDSRSNGGVIALDINTNSKIWSITDPFGKESQYLHLFVKGNLKSIIVLSTGGVYSINVTDSLHVSIIYSKSGKSNSLYGSFLFVDINSDSFEDLIVAFNNSNSATLKGVSAINLVTGTSLWSSSLTFNEAIDRTFYDLAFNKVNNSIMFVVSVSNFISDKKYYFFNEKGVLSSTKIGFHIDSSSLISQSALGDFNGDNNFELATATTDKNFNQLQVRTIDSFNLLFSMNLKELGGSLWSRIPLLVQDVNNDSKDDLILTFARFNSSDTSSNLYNPTSYNKGLIIALDINVPVVLWERRIYDSITNVEAINYNNKTAIVVYTENLGVLGVATNGADLFWSAGGVYPVSFSLSGNKTLISTFNGYSYVSEFKGLLKRADNFVTSRPFINKDVNTDLFLSDNLVKIINLDIFNKGSEELLFAYANGTINLIDYRSGLFMKINLSPFSKISANTIHFESNKYGFVIKTDTSDILIFDATSTKPKISIKTPGPLIGDIIPFNLANGQIDSIIIQTKTTYGYMLSIYNLQSKLYSWNRTYANQITWFNVGSFDGSNPTMLTHIIALDDNGVAKLIELPNINYPGGAFVNPDLGRWTRIETSKNANGLTDVYLGSDKGQIYKFSWDLQGNYKITKFTYQTLESKQTPTLIITEIMHHPPNEYSVDADWIELFNPTNIAFSLNGWYVTNSVLTNKFYLSGTITAGGYIVIARDKLIFNSMYGFLPDLEWKINAPNLKLSDSNESVFVYSDTNIVTYEKFGWSTPPSNFSITAIGTTLLRNTTKSFGDTNHVMIVSSTLGTPKNGPYNQKILFSEVYYNTKYSPNNSNYQWIELYNPTGSDIDLSQWKIRSDFANISFAFSGTIKANGYFVIAKNEMSFKKIYGFSPDYTFNDYLSYLNIDGDKLGLYNNEGVNLDEVGWGNYKSLPISTITANKETIQRTSIIDTDSGSDFIPSGGFGNPGYGQYLQSSILLQLKKGLNNEILFLVENSNKELVIIHDNGQNFNSTRLMKTVLAGMYENSFITNVNGGNLEIGLMIGNSILILNSNGKDYELYSFSGIVKNVINWNIDKVDKVSLIAQLDNGKVILVDPAGRKNSCFIDQSYCTTNMVTSSNSDIKAIEYRDYEFLVSENRSDDSKSSPITYLNFKNMLIGSIFALPPVIPCSAVIYKRYKNKNKIVQKEDKRT